MYIIFFIVDIVGICHEQNLKKIKKKSCGEETCHFDTVLTVLEAVG